MGKMNMRLARLLTVCVLCLAMTVGSGVTAAAKSKKKSSVISDKDSPVIIVWEDEYLHETVEQRIEWADEALDAFIYPDNSLKKYTYLYVGASRADKLSRSVRDSKTAFVTMPGAGSRWFGKSRFGVSPCLITIRSYLLARPDGNVIIELGNNDPQRPEVYVHVYRRLIEMFPEAHFWFVDALPGTGSGAHGASKNKERKILNNRLKEEFPQNSVGGYSYLLHSPNFRTTDGVHYPAYGERNLYKYVMKKIGRKIRYSGKTVVEV